MFNVGVSPNGHYLGSLSENHRVIDVGWVIAVPTTAAQAP